MFSDWWDEPVYVMMGTQTREIARLDEAAELIKQWPGDGSFVFANAHEAIAKALADSESSSARQAARMAFEAAAREAGILRPIVSTYKKPPA